MKTIIGVGFNMPSTLDDCLKLDSHSSLADADIVIFSPNLSKTSYSTYTDYSSQGEYEGKKLYNKESSADMQEHAIHWKNELKHFLNIGKTVFFLLCKKEDFYVHTGTKDISGTGRNQKITNHVTNFSNYNFSPFSKTIMNSATGKNVLPANPIVTDLYNNFKDRISFEGYLTGEGLNEPLFTTKDKARVLGVLRKIESGNLLMIPDLQFPNEVFKKYDSKKSKYFWNDNALRMGKILHQNLYEIDKKLRGNDEKAIAPTWITESKFDLRDAKATQVLIEENEIVIKGKQEENVRLKEIQVEQESLKDLLFETGKPLERVVSKALRILGYQAESFDNGELELDQIIVSPEGQRYIGECEGKDNKDIDVSKFRQLLDGLNADFEREDVNEKASGLLIGNPQRLINPQERILDFTQKCKIGAQREGVGLIKTVDLFLVSRYIQECNDQEFKKRCRQAILEGLGKIVMFPDVPTQDNVS